MSATDYVEICKENLTKYGTEVSNYGKVLLSEAYKERTHFLFELLQNAEDACERKSMKSTRSQTCFVKIDLFPDRLEFRHNGDLFDPNDVRGVCGIVDTTKNDEYKMVGKFGIGFKSVYAFTNSPEIHSGQESFKISNYVYPSTVKKREDLAADETFIVIRFDKDDPNPETSYSEIHSKLKKLDYATMLFLRRIDHLSWTVEGKTEVIERKQEPLPNNCMRISIEGSSKTENWLLFSKKVGDKYDSSVRIAYKLQKRENSTTSIVPMHGAKIYNYFETDKATYLKFPVDGPFHTTPARDNIKDDKWNVDLILKSANLVGDSLEDAKKLGFLNVDFLNMLPITSPDLAENDEFLYRPFFEKVKEKLCCSKLLPSEEGYLLPNEAAISRSDDLRKLIGIEQMESLLEKHVEWLNSTITQDNYPDLRNYLMKELHIPEITPESFAGMVSKNFLELQTDEWIINFYSFLRGRKALWEGSYSNPILRNKPIIRLYDNTHIEPFQSDGKPKANLPTSKLNPKLNKPFNPVKDIIASDKNAREFLTDLGLREIGKETVILSCVLPKYLNSSIEVDEEQNLLDLDWVAKTINQNSFIDEHNLIQEIKRTPILLSVNAQSSIKEYKTPSEIFLPKGYSGSSDLETFYAGYEKAWFLDKRYMETKELDVNFFSLIGCKSEIVVRFRQPGYSGFVTLHDYHSDHMRGIDGFDPDASILGLDHVLSEISVEKAKIIWSLLSKNYQLIKGTTEWSSRATFDDTEKESVFSEIGKLLIDNAWVPTKDGSFKRPTDIEMTDVLEDLFSGIQETPLVAEKLGIKDDVENRVIQKYPIIKKLESLPIGLRMKAESEMNSIIKKFRSAEESQNSNDDVSSMLRSKLKVGSSLSDDHPMDGMWRSLSEREETTIRENYPEKTQEKMDNSALNTKISYRRESTVDGYDPKAFLLSEYDGHCQVCNERLELGNGRTPYFETFRLIKENENPRASEGEFNVICLCPNCHALAEYGGRDLSQLEDSVQSVLESSKIAEAIEERGGDYYVFNILLAGKPSKIYYTQRHLNQFISILSKKGN